MAKFPLFSILITLASLAQAQPNEALTVRFQPQWHDSPLELNVQLSGKHAPTIETFQFYLTHFTAWEGENRVYEDSKAHLLDFSDPSSLLLDLPLTDTSAVTHISFCVGVDSLTNVSGAFGGELDPMRGMYWTWQSGYINLKLEGNSPLSPSRYKDFQFHIGGYQYPHKSLQTVKITFSPLANPAIGIQLDRLFADLDWENTHHIMSPGSEAMEFARSYSTLFSQLP